MIKMKLIKWEFVVLLLKKYLNKYIIVLFGYGMDVILSI